MDPAKTVTSEGSRESTRSYKKEKENIRHDLFLSKLPKQRVRQFAIDSEWKMRMRKKNTEHKNG